jgi:hypothetical protein
MRSVFLLLSILIAAANAQYIEGDFVNEISFTDSDLDSASNIIYSQKNTKELISSGKVIVLSFFNPG